LSPQSFLPPRIFFHHHHLALWFLFFIFVASCNYALVFIKLRNQGLRVSFLFLFVLSPSSFPRVLVFVLICNSFPLQCVIVTCFVAIFFVLVFVLHDLLCNAFPSSSAMLHLCIFSCLCLFFVFIYMSLFVHFLDGFCFLIMFIGNGGFA
jgi:hypothetical protein